MKDQRIIDWLSSLGNKSPAPGGGAVAGLNGAIAAAQIMMVCAYTKSELKGKQALEQKTQTFLELSEQDSQAYLKVKNAYKSGDEKFIQKAIVEATEPSASMLANCEDLYNFCEVNLGSFNNNLLADLIVALANIRASIESAQSMLVINAKSMNAGSDKAETEEKIKDCDKLIAKVDALKSKVKAEIE